MAVYTYTIRLASDAEPGTGLGGEIVNVIAPRNHQGTWVLNASHVKGLMRQALIDLIEALGESGNGTWNEALLDRTFGQRDERRAGVEAAFRLTDATATCARATCLVTRTSVDGQTGVAKDTSLRTAESIPVDTVFQGELHSQAAEGSAEDIAWRLALLAIPAIGGNRNRGCGLCVTGIREGAASENGPVEQRTPGQLLRALAESLQADASKPASPPAVHTAAAARRQLAQEPAVVRLQFTAQTPICCPEIPDKTNVIRTGFSIPASAVQGAILTRIQRDRPDLADALYHSPQFRAWPLQPCRHPDDASATSNPTAAVRVSLTHRVAKFSAPAGFEPDDFQDEAIRPYNALETIHGAPLKASDGVLLWDDRSVLLWRAADMPHVVTSHGVHNDPFTDNGRNLFTVDAMAPLIWQGLIGLPQDAAEAVVEMLDKDPVVAIGKSRTVRGLGRLRATRLKGIPTEWRTPPGQDHTVLVVQSPILLPLAPRTGTAEEELADLARRWAERSGLPAPAVSTTRNNGFVRAQPAWANLGIRFGWNRHTTGRQNAVRVVLPGSLITFDQRLDAERLCHAISRGFYDPDNGPQDEGRTRGFGAVSVHPGRATGFYRYTSPIETQSASMFDEIRLVLRMRQTVREHGGRLPSPSQIRAVQQRLIAPGRDEASRRDEALKYLERQTERTTRIWFTWQAIHEPVVELLTKYPAASAARALEVLADLANLDQKEQRP